MEIKLDRIRGYLFKAILTGPELARNKTIDARRNPLPQRSAFIKLQKYAKNFLETEVHQRIVILPGLRGVGKTTLLLQVFDWFHRRKEVPKERLLYLSLDYLKENLGASLSEVMEVYERDFLKKPFERVQEPLILFLDEAHYDSSWQIIVKNLYDRTNKVLIFVSGSSALALGASADLVRRSIIDTIFPLTFQEYLLLKKGFFPPTGISEKIRIALNSVKDEAYYVLNDTYKRLQERFLNSSIDIESELKAYLISGGFPSFLGDKEYRNTFSWLEKVLEKVVTRDIPIYSQLSPKESHNLFLVLHFLAESFPPGPQSLSNLSRIGTNVSEATTFNMMKALEKSCIIFPLQPNSKSSRLTKKSPKYYFCTPTIRCALLWNLGKFNEHDSRINGVLLEEAIFDILIKNLEKQKLIQRVSYDYGSGGADFIVKMPTGNVIIEVGWGTKGSEQINATMKRVKSKFGILVSNQKHVSIDGVVIKIPRELILFS